MYWWKDGRAERKACAFHRPSVNACEASSTTSPPSQSIAIHETSSCCRRRRRRIECEEVVSVICFNSERLKIGISLEKLKKKKGFVLPQTPASAAGGSPP